MRVKILLVLLNILVGAVVGFLVLHPVSMYIIVPEMKDSLANLLTAAFSLQHVPMAIYFTSLGALLGLVQGIYLIIYRRLTQRIDRLEHLLPVCANCKRIRRDASRVWTKADWVTVESYLQEHYSTVFTHTICEECMEVLYPEYADRLGIEKKARRKKER